MASVKKDNKSGNVDSFPFLSLPIFLLYLCGPTDGTVNEVNGVGPQ